MLSVNVEKRLGEFSIAASFETTGGATALFGPSGAGKTSIVSMIGGLLAPDRGRIALDDTVLFDSAARINVPAHRRRIGTVFQEGRLFPHMTVARNLDYGRWMSGLPADPAERERIVSLLNIGTLLQRRPGRLSGGERQRVAIGRALLMKPRLLLLDEPLASLDPNRREELRGLIVRLQSERGLTTLIVTHDRAEAAELGDSVALMLEGSIVQHDEPQVVFERPASAAAARFFGAANILRGPVRDGRLAFAGAELPVEGPDGSATVVIRPEHVMVTDDATLRGTVVEAIYAGTHVRLTIACGAQCIEAHAPTGCAPCAGADVGLDLPRERLWRLPDGGLVSAAD